MTQQNQEPTPDQMLERAQAIVNRLSFRLQQTTEELISVQVENDMLRERLRVLTEDAPSEPDTTD